MDSPDTDLDRVLGDLPVGVLEFLAVDVRGPHMSNSNELGLASVSLSGF